MDGEGWFLDETRRWLAELPDGALRRRLDDAARAYRAALAVQALDPDRVDRLEDDLQDLFAEAAAREEA